MSRPYQLISVSDRPVAYGEALAWQMQLFERRRLSQQPDTLLLLEHHPVVTIGRGSHPEMDLLRSEEELRLDGIELYVADRGGEMTYHAPGQLVGYPIIRLDETRGERDLHKYLRKLEQVVIDSLREVGIDGERKSGLTGVWVKDEKIAAIGIKVSRWVTMHGFSLNIDLDLTPMRRDIVPCGIRDFGVTSIAELGYNFSRSDVEPTIIRNFERHFDRHALP